MGAYCTFCGTRCFVERQIPGRPGTVLMATCQAGALEDLFVTDYDYTTAVNPRSQEVRDGSA
jgi:hypothetical protein